MTCHVRHNFTPINETIKKIIDLIQQFVNCNNSIPSNQNGLLCKCKMRSVLDCYNNNQSIPFGIVILYIMVQKFEVLNSYFFTAVKCKENIIFFAHNFILKTKTQTKAHCLSSNTIEYISPLY